MSFFLALLLCVVVQVLCIIKDHLKAIKKDLHLIECHAHKVAKPIITKKVV